MLESTLPIVVVTAVFFAIAIGGFFFAGRSHPDRGLVQTMIVTTCLCLWLFWLMAYLAQLHPLVAPDMNVDEVCATNKEGNLVCY